MRRVMMHQSWQQEMRALHLGGNALLELTGCTAGQKVSAFVAPSAYAPRRLRFSMYSCTRPSCT